MALASTDIASIIKKEIEGYGEKLKLENVGHVMQVGDGVARIYGLDDCLSSELLEFPENVYGIAMNLEEDNVGAILLGSDEKIKEGDIVEFSLEKEASNYVIVKLSKQNSTGSSQ